MKKMLVVDDEKDLRELLKYRFESYGFTVFTAKDGKEAIEIAKKEQPQVIIMDLVMPNMDGISAHKVLKSDDTTKHIPIIAYTAQPPEVVAKKGLEAFDVVDFVFKPFDTKGLVASVERAVGKKIDEK